MPAAADPARVVLVTGAAKRLGREIALALAQDGWQVAVHYRDSVEEAHRTTAQCAQLSGRSESFRANLANETAVRRLLPAVIGHFGHVDAVVNSASTFEHDSATSFGFAAMEKHMRSNAGAAILLAQALHTHIAERRAAASAMAPPATTAAKDEPSADGRMDRRSNAVAPVRNAAPSAKPTSAHSNPTSPANRSDFDDESGSTPAATTPPLMGAVVNLLDQKLWNQNPDFLSYTLSKAALEAANTMLALALAPLVRVVGVAPGLTLTSQLLSDDAFRERHKMALLDQSSTPADVAATVRFALENRSITGTSLLVDGGQHLMRFERDFSLM
jgi:NAD(P)-dependent dehydrogenase (short-subunit alcohol dehydrogenase family)